MKIDALKYRNILERYKIKTDRTVINFVLQNVERKTFEHIVYKYPDKPYIATVIKYFEELEEYEKCQEIKQFIEINNRLNGNQTKTVL